jgi:hypothetical protein
MMRAIGSLCREVRAMESLEEVQKANRELAEQINNEARSNPNSPYAGKFVGIANGKIVVVTDDEEDLYYRLEEIEPDPRRVFGLDAGHDPNEVEYIWRS